MPLFVDVILGFHLYNGELQQDSKFAIIFIVFGIIFTFRIIHLHLYLHMTLTGTNN